MSKRLAMQNDTVYDDPPPQRPLIALQCPRCPGYQEFELNSATQPVCGGCGEPSSNDHLVDLNQEGRL